MTEKISIPIRQELVAEFYARAGTNADITTCIENVFSNFLDHTRYEDHLWQDSWVNRRNEEDADGVPDDCGPPGGGYRWGPMLLRNGTKIRMEYKSTLHYATVKHDRIIFNDQACSPSQLASSIASNTSRNAWRDLWIQEPGSSSWVLANDLRRGHR
jgi:hypothetical protein